MQRLQGHPSKPLTGNRPNKPHLLAMRRSRQRLPGHQRVTLRRLRLLLHLQQRRQLGDSHPIRRGRAVPKLADGVAD